MTLLMGVVGVPRGEVWHRGWSGPAIRTYHLSHLLPRGLGFEATTGLVGVTRSTWITGSGTPQKFGSLIKIWMFFSHPSGAGWSRRAERRKIKLDVFHHRPLRLD